MYRQSPSRNSQRSKRIKVKHVLQFSLLLGVGFWLLYQLKHSHDKNVEFEKTEVKGIPESLNGIELPKLGRKGIQDIFEETLPKNVKYREPVNEEETGDDEENKIEESETKSQTLLKIEDQGEVDELEENDQEGTDADYEELPGDEKDKELDDENEAEETGANEAGAGNSVEETDRKARETQYKADDASSAVAHDSQTRSLENAEEHSEQLETHNISLGVAKNDTRKDLKVLVDEMNGEHKLNMTNDSSAGVTEDSVEGSPRNSTTESLAELAAESQNASLNSTINEGNIEAVFPGLKSGNGSILSTVSSNQSNSSNSTDSADKTSDATKSELSPNETASEDMARTEASDDVEVDSIDGSSDKVESTSNDELQEILREAVDALPDTQNNEAEDAAAE